jgi:hypothetical protein
MANGTTHYDLVTKKFDRLFPDDPLAALSGDAANIFDTMPYAAAAVNRVILQDISIGVTDLGAIVNGDTIQGPASLPDGSKISSEYVDGEILQSVRDNANSGEAATEGLFVGSLATYFIGKDAGKTALHALENEINKVASQGSTTGLDPNASSFDNPISLHSSALLVLLQYASDNGLTSWQSIGQPLYAAYKDDDLAAPFSLTAKQMLSEIAYSAIDQGVMPFGDTGIKALFSDADQLGSLYSSDAISGPLDSSSVKTDITEMLVQYAGDLAQAADTVAKHASGIVTYNADSSSLNIDLSDAAWLVNGSRPSTIVGENDLIKTLTSDIQNPPDVSGIHDIVVAASDSGGTLSAEKSLTSSEGALLVAGSGDTTVTGSAGNDIIIGGAGKNTLTRPIQR